ncbi:MAG: AMP-binding protein, partial [Myxococcales bacterium]|nr:AMP-binding protein [Myxococcales bacterium]
MVATPTIPRFASLLAALEHHAAVRPDKAALLELDHRALPKRQYTFAELRNRARKVGGALACQHPMGARAVLMTQSVCDFAAAFIGCVYAGMVPVPASPPRSAQALQHLVRLVDDCGATLIL